MKFQPKYAPIEIGERFGLWTVISKGSFKHNQQRWLCRCECGNMNEVASAHLRSGKSTKCVPCVGRLKSIRVSKENLGLYNSNRRLYGIQAQIDTLYKEQDGKCVICQKPFTSKNDAVWDHDHQTGMGRSLLHKGCNVFLGFIERDTQLLKRTVEYCNKFGIKFDTINVNSN